VKIKIGVIGSGSDVEQEIRKKSQNIGKEIAEMGCILLTGSGLGLPYEAAKGAKQAGGLVIGISPAASLQEHSVRYKFPKEFFDVLIFTGFGLKGRNVPFIRTCDAVVAISGGTGTLNEFTIAYDEGKVIGLLKGTGGLCDNVSVENFVKASWKKGGKIITNDDPKLLIKELLENAKSF
jgi:uncharacterized protein (TIGR00725 family)